MMILNCDLLLYFISVLKIENIKEKSFMNKFVETKNVMPMKLPLVLETNKYSMWDKLFCAANDCV